MGRGSCRGDADGISAAQGTSPADEVHEHAGAVQRGAPLANACRQDLSERGVLSASDLGTCGGDP